MGNKYKFVICLIIINVLFLPLNAESKNRIAILDFSANNTSPSNAKIVRNAFEVAIYKTGNFDILERREIDLILKEQGLQVSGCIDTACAVEIGKILSADLVAIGSLDKFGDFVITLKVLSIKEGKVVFADNERAADENKILNSIDIIVNRMAGEEAVSGKEMSTMNKGNTAEQKANQDNVNVSGDAYISNDAPKKYLSDKEIGLFLNYNIINPIGSLSKYIRNAYGISAGIDMKDFVIKNLFLGIEVGYYDFNSKSWTYSKLTPLKTTSFLIHSRYEPLIYMGYNIYFAPIFTGGVARNRYSNNMDYYNGNIETTKWQFICKGGGRIGLYLTQYIDVHSDAELIYTNGSMDFFMISFGLCYRI